MDNVLMLEEIFTAQCADFQKNGEFSLQKRQAILRDLISLLVDNQYTIAEAINQDFSCRHFQLSRLADIGAAIESLKFALKNVEKWAKPQSKPTSPAALALFGARAKLMFQAKGIVGIIVPWNFPINLSFGPLAGVIAAGNRAMIKLSEFTPATSQLLDNLISKYFDKSHIAVINGGVEIAEKFSSLAFNHLLFTGATSVGKVIMEKAAHNLVPVTLELGGKSPVIIGETADSKTAAARIIAGKLMNAGQVCLAPDYLLVPENRLDDLVSELVQAVRSQYPTIFENPEYTAIINDRHFARLNDYIAQAKTSGSKIIAHNDGNNGGNSRKIAPHFIINPNDDLKIMQDEIFGPILPIKTYKNIDEAISFINARQRPLALYYFGNDLNEKEKVVSKTISGGVTINDVIFHIAMEHLPFGGVGASGMGAYHGHRGFLEFSHQKAIYQQARNDNAILKAMRAPYGKILEKYLNFVIKK